MPTFYDPSVLGYVTADEDGNVTAIRHSQELRSASSNIPLEAAGAYLHDVADVLRLDAGQLDHLHVRAQDLTPAEAGAEFQLSEDKTIFDSTTVSFSQTFFDVPVFRRGVSVELKHGPNRVVGVTSNTEPELAGRAALAGADRLLPTPLRRRRRIARPRGHLR